MPDDLRRLLKLYEMYDSASIERGQKSRASTSANLVSRQRDRVLLEIATFSSTDPRVTRLQIKFLLSCLGGLTCDKAAADMLREACMRHVDNLAVLAKETSQHGPRSSPDLKLRGKRRRAAYTWRSNDFACLDAMNDRAAVFDRDYRYVTTNRSNAEFHKSSKDAFSRRGHWEVMGNDFFERISKPKFDACLAGQTSAYCANKFASNGEIYWIRLSPVRDANNAVVGILAIAADLSMLDIPTGMVA